MNLCKHLSYEASLRPGKAVFFYKTEDSDFEPLEVEVSKIRGQKCSHSEAYSGDDGLPKNVQPQDLAYSNPVIVESCYVPPNVKRVYCRFSLRVMANSIEPAICSEPEVIKKLKEFSEIYKELGGYKYLARRYCKNILMGSWLWRNQYARQIEIEVLTSNNSIFKVKNLHRMDFDSTWDDDDNKKLDSLSLEFEEALTDPYAYGFFDVTANIETEFCQEIFPSQLFTDKSDPGTISKQYLKIDCPDGRLAAGMTAGKLGAAIQLIDDWWAEGADHALRVHEYGADRNLVIAQRTPERGNDFYSILKNLEDYIEHLKCIDCIDQIPGDIHYLTSMLIKAGMFQRGK
jgi:CRISPR-associated protein Csy3